MIGLLFGTRYIPKIKSGIWPVGEEVALDGLILPGHVSVILGTRPYEFLAQEFGTAGVITGFQPTEVLQGIFMLLEQVADGKPRIENQYAHVVKPWPPAPWPTPCSPGRGH